MTDLSVYRYSVAPIPPEDGGGYVVSFPDIPGCLSVGDTPVKVLSLPALMP
jgi:antitoxin HicB